MEDQNDPYPWGIDLDNCAREPIHIIGSTQEFGLLLVADPYTFEITQCGANSSNLLSASPEELLGKDLGSVLGREVADSYRKQLDSGVGLTPRQLLLKDKAHLLVARLSGSHLLLDLEPLQEDREVPQLADLYTDFSQRRSSSSLPEEAARLAKQYFGYDRVMIYRFDEEWNGEVVAEEKEPEMESWYGLHYPATDIPAQSRAMFLKNGMRMISDVNYSPVPIVPERSPLTRRPLDISDSALRAVSPIHIEYLKNMGVGASLTAAIAVRGRLWGLLAFHHRTPRFLDHHSREGCRFLAQLLATELAVTESETFLQKTFQMDRKREQLKRQVKKSTQVSQGLCEGPIKFTDLFPCGGGALYLNGDWSYVGEVPPPQDLQELLEEFLMPRHDILLETNVLGSFFPKALKYKDKASGLLSLRLTENKYLLWFRPELVQTVEWGGDPNNKVFYNEKEQRLSPRRSFEKWTELKQDTALPWKDYDLNTARALGEDLSYELMDRQRNEIEQLYFQLFQANKDLELFSYGLSHDLRAPIRGIEGLLDIILEDYAADLHPQGVEYLKKAIGLSSKLELLIDDILNYSRLSHSKELKMETIDTASLLEEVLEFISARSQYPQTRIQLQESLPQVRGDRSMLAQVWANLLSNALKYSRNAPMPRVEAGTLRQDGRTVFFVRDNGIGFAEKFRESIFEPFSRAVGSEFEGTGIGLALARKILEKHGGEIWAESEPGKGSIFYLYLPIIKEH